MEDQSFWFRLIEALWIAVPTTLLLLALAVLVRRRPEPSSSDDGALVYTIHCNADGRLRIYRHGQFAEHEPALLLVAPAMHDELQAPYTAGIGEA